MGRRTRQTRGRHAGMTAGRWLGLLLVVVSLGGTVGLPLADALRHDHSESAAGAHLERLGGCGAHAEHCILATRSVPPPADLPQAVHGQVHDIERTPSAGPRAIRAYAPEQVLPPSRAPPASPA
jgi:hypothetical protein